MHLSLNTGVQTVQLNLLVLLFFVLQSFLSCLGYMRITQAYEMINTVVFPCDYKLYLHLPNCVAHRH